MLKDEIRAIPSAPKDLRKFGITLGVFFGLLAGLFLWKQSGAAVTLAAVAAFFLLSSLLTLPLLKPIQKVWMTAALLIGWVMTKVLLAVVFFLVVTPLALLTRAAGKDFLDKKMRDGRSSYWKDRLPRDKAGYENQF